MLQVSISDGMATLPQKQFNEMLAQVSSNWISLQMAQEAVDRLCGKGGGPDLSCMTPQSVLSVRKSVFINTIHNGKDTHEDLITVLRYMSRYITGDLSKITEPPYVTHMAGSVV